MMIGTQEVRTICIPLFTRLFSFFYQVPDISLGLSHLVEVCCMHYTTVCDVLHFDTWLRCLRLNILRVAKLLANGTGGPTYDSYCAVL